MKKKLAFSGIFAAVVAALCWPGKADPVRPARSQRAEVMQPQDYDEPVAASTRPMGLSGPRIIHVPQYEEREPEPEPERKLPERTNVRRVPQAAHVAPLYNNAIKPEEYRPNTMTPIYPKRRSYHPSPATAPSRTVLAAPPSPPVDGPSPLKAAPRWRTIEKSPPPAAVAPEADSPAIPPLSDDESAPAEQ